MAVVIRLTQMGKKGERKYRVAVKEKRSKRDGGAIEYLGWYEKTEKEHKKQIDKARYDYWLSKGAKPSPTVEKIMQ
jgi:small subunit ribosomal protein S16